MPTPAERRAALRPELALLRNQIEANMDIALAHPTDASHQVQAVELQRDFMRSLLAYVDAGGIVLATPLYKNNCIAGRYRIRKRMVHQLLHFKRYYPSSAIPPFLDNDDFHLPGTGVFFVVHAVKRKDGVITHLQRLLGPIGEPGEDGFVWKWMFCDLGEDEDVGTIVREKSRWGWAGKFGVGVDLEEGVPFGRMDVPVGDPDRIFELA